MVVGWVEEEDIPMAGLENRAVRWEAKVTTAHKPKPDIEANEHCVPCVVIAMAASPVELAHSDLC